MNPAYFGALRIAAQAAGHPVIMHGHEDGVRTHKRKPEVGLRQRFIHHAPEHFREPIIGCGKNAEDRRHAHDQMEVRDDEVRLVQVNVQHGLRQERAADSADNKQRNESDCKQHRRRETDLPSPQRPEPVKGLDG